MRYSFIKWLSFRTCSMQVHTRFWTCSKSVNPSFCVCGVAARDGDDVIVIDMCGGRFMETSVQISVRSGPPLTRGIRITEATSGKRYTVREPGQRQGMYYNKNKRFRYKSESTFLISHLPGVKGKCRQSIKLSWLYHPQILDQKSRVMRRQII